MRKILDKLTNPWVGAAAFAIWNVIMYATLKYGNIPVKPKFWIGGSSFLPLIGSKVDKFIFALTVNVGVIVGSFLAAVATKEFFIRVPDKKIIIRSIIGGFFMGIGITLAPGTCSTPFVTGLPHLSVSSFFSILGTLIGAYIAYRVVGRKW